MTDIDSLFKVCINPLVKFASLIDSMSSSYLSQQLSGLLIPSFLPYRNLHSLLHPPERPVNARLLHPMIQVRISLAAFPLARCTPEFKHIANPYPSVAAYKAAKLSSTDTSPDRTAHVDDAPEDTEYETSDAASSLPADFFDAPETANAEEDEDGGRFFGGGVDKKQAEYLNYIDEAEKEVVATEKIDVQWLRKKALAFEKKINKNSEMRGKFEDEPHKFMASEEELDAEIKNFSILSEHPELFKEFRKLGSLRSLVQLLAHENTDIAIDVVEVISELTDDEVEAEPEQWSELVDGMVEEQVLEMLVQNLGRLNEGNEADRSGVYHTLSEYSPLHCSGVFTDCL